MKPNIHIVVLAAAVGWTHLAVTAPVGGRIISTCVTNSQMRLLFETTSGCSYQVQSSPAGRGRFWDDALPLLTATGSLTSVLVPAPVGAEFFKVLQFTNRVFWYDWTYYYEALRLGKWGLGSAQTAYSHTDRPYDWYIDQADTGSCSNNNCGPAVVTMAGKWYSPAFSKTAADARNTYFEGGGWWYTSDIINYLRLCSVPSTISFFTGADQLKGVLSQGNLVVVCIDTTYLVQDTNPDHRVGRFYNYAGGHFLVAKGWRQVDKTVFFEVYDPNNSHAAYSDQTPKGRNRHLLAGDLANAIANWWNYLIVIPPPGGAAFSLKANALLAPVDPAGIKQAWGR